MNPDIEVQIDDLANLAQIHGRIFEEISAVGNGANPNYVVNYQTYSMLSFLVGEICGRTIKLVTACEQAHDTKSKGGSI
jgi:hypothetical protein